MDTYLNAAVAAERQHQLIVDAERARRSAADRKPKARHRRNRSHRVSGFLRDLAAASL
jgi:hypothetical protein